MKTIVSEKGKALRVHLADDEAPLAAVQAAAHLLADRAYAVVERRAGGLSVTLTPKEEAGAEALRALGELFKTLVADQDLRRRLTAGGRELLEYIVSHALIPAAPQPTSEPPAQPLTPEQQAEIDSLILAAEAEITELKKQGSDDPLGIRRTWEEKNGR